MLYKTIVLELIKQQPDLYIELTRNNSLTSTLEQLANQLRDSHLSILEQMQLNQPDQSLIAIKSEAMEIAISQLQESMQVNPQTETDEVFSLDAAMAHLKRNTPRD